MTGLAFMVAAALIFAAGAIAGATWALEGRLRDWALGDLVKTTALIVLAVLGTVVALIGLLVSPIVLGVPWLIGIFQKRELKHVDRKREPHIPALGRESLARILH